MKITRVAKIRQTTSSRDPSFNRLKVDVNGRKIKCFKEEQ